MAEQRIQKTVRGAGVWEHFTVRDGLPDMKIECLFEDSRGMLWIGTHDRGAVRFDGDQFEVFTTGDGLASGTVHSILEDREGKLWFGASGGLTVYDSREFQKVDLSSGENLCFLWGSCEDRDGRLWFGVAGRPARPSSVCRWDGRELVLIPLVDTTDEGNLDISCIVVDAKGDLWVGGEGLYRYDGETFGCVEEAPDTAGTIMSLLPRDDGPLWIGAANGLFAYREGTLESVVDEFVGRRIKALLEDPSGTVWLTGEAGEVMCYENGAVRVVGKLRAGLWGNLCVDRVGRLWLGTFEGGLYCYDPTRFEVFGREQGLGSEHVLSLSEDVEGMLLVGTRAGLVRYDGDAFRPVEIPEEQMRQAEQARDLPVSVWVDSRDRLWFVRSRGKLYVVEEDGDVHLVLQGRPTSEAFIAEDRRGRIWFGFPFGGMIAQSEYGFGYYENGHVRLFPSDTTEDCPTKVGALLVDRRGVVWIGSSYPTSWNGLCRYDGECFTAFTSADGLAGGGIFALCEDQEGHLWIGATQGVSRYDGERFVTFTQADGLPDGIVRAIAQTQDSKVWFGSDGGDICCYDGQVFQVIRVPENAGCNTFRTIYQDHAGQIWLGTSGGLVRYTPQQIPPEVLITRVVADRTYEVTETIEIPTTIGRIGFCFQGKSPVDLTSRLVYRYRLDGYDQDWQQTRATQVDYPQLPPGEYGFCVQAVDTGLNYSEVRKIPISVVSDPRVAGLTEALRVGGGPGEFVGESTALHRVLSQIREVARTNLTVLITGETGTGKGLVARAIHGMSDQRDGPFIPVNCGAIPEGLVESELFGHEKGAFTGAASRKLGKVELAEGGTLFLDEIGDLPLSAQAKLLRFLEDRTFERVGGERTLEVNVRVIAATNRDLERMVSEEGFREDLYYRLHTFVIQVPPLRERREDVPLLVRYFAERFAGHLNRPVPEIDVGAMKHLQRYRWPGNVRELEHQVQRAVLSCRDNIIRVEDMLVGEIQGERSSESGAFLPLEEQEKRHIERALEAAGWVIYGERGAARLLGIHPENLRVRIRKHGLRRPR